VRGACPHTGGLWQVVLELTGPPILPTPPSANNFHNGRVPFYWGIRRTDGGCQREALDAWDRGRAAVSLGRGRV
jgi:hypothetical protein